VSASVLPASEPPFELMLISNLVEVAKHAIDSGVDLLFVDLEIKGKQQRQAGRSTVISRHSMDDVANMRAALPLGRLLVRVNPWDSDSQLEVEEVLARGADRIMLPMFRGPKELEGLISVVRGRCEVVGLLETAEAAASARDIAAVDGLSRIHIGLNDLHLAMRKRFMFELLIDGTVERVAEALRARSVPFGIGGLARVGEGLVPAESLAVEHVMLGSTAAILSRTFHRGDTDDSVLSGGPRLAEEIVRLREALRHCRQMPAAELAALRADMAAKIRRVVEGA
jgi:hypothetical protein